MKDNSENFNSYKDLKTLLPEIINDFESSQQNDFNKAEEHVMTGFKDINFKKGNLIILASRSCLGKTCLALNLLLNIASNTKKGVGYVTCGEHDEIDISRKLLAISSEISISKINRSKLNEDELKKLREKSDELLNTPVFINDSPNIFFEEFELESKLMVEQQNVEIIFVDSYEYLREVVDADKDELPCVHKELLKKYKEVARDLNIPIVMLMNLPHSDDDKEPSISDFKENMIIPRTADVVFLLHRERIMNDGKKCEATMLVGKNVNGRYSDIPLWFYPETGGFKDFA